jgi:hypothetical protein
VVLDTVKLSNGVHEFTIQGIDRFGNKIKVVQEGLVANPDLNLNKRPIIIFQFLVNDTDFPNTTDKILIKAIKTINSSFRSPLSIYSLTAT